MQRTHLILTTILMSLIITSAHARLRKRCSIEKSMKPKCYHKRSEAVLKVALIYYGDHMQMEDLERVEKLLAERFLEATDKLLSVEVVDKKIIPFKQTMPLGYQFNNIKDPKRLQRIFYAEHVGGKVLEEIYEQYKSYTPIETVRELDAVLAITGAQFQGLGLATGRISAVEHPQEIAWALKDGGRVKYLSDYSIVDELIHEIGHNIFIGHASTQCQKPGLTLQQRNACCDASAAKNDVMSYCRKRDLVSEEVMYGFKECNLDKIQNLIIPAMLKGGRWNVDNSKRCR